jgi:hypothetical protein
MMASPIFSPWTDFAPVRPTIKINVIKTQELGISNATAGTFATAILLESLNLKLQMLILQLCRIVRESSFGPYRFHPFHSSIIRRKSRKR